MYTFKVIISQKWCKVDVVGHSGNAGPLPLKCNVLYSCVAVDKISADRARHVVVPVQ